MRVARAEVSRVATHALCVGVALCTRPNGTHCPVRPAARTSGKETCRFFSAEM